MMNKTHPFNNEVESGLRTLFILNEAYPVSLDLEKIIHLDYLTVHSGDIDKTQRSIHPAVPYRTGELYVRRNFIKGGISLFVEKNLISVNYSPDGIEYYASEYSSPFVESLGEKYSLRLKERASWAVKGYLDYSIEELKKIIKMRFDSINDEFNLEILS
ncbi:ABC-three component system middle component 2 [uncultured Tenacibaculum sp.]|uniref:ABC-three component system middle component 2 n=1 Tax=uncultured Tenacibaculum sp. TaxID=174713 RepID=UPI0026143C20|nr:ABC-three component system middle component 2 [uncultured Tenacibaculum sp.]